MSRAFGAGVVVLAGEVVEASLPVISGRVGEFEVGWDVVSTHVGQWQYRLNLDGNGWGEFSNNGPMSNSQDHTVPFPPGFHVQIEVRIWVDGVYSNSLLGGRQT